MEKKAKVVSRSESDGEESQSSEQEKTSPITDPITDGGNFNDGNYN